MIFRLECSSSRIVIPGHTIAALAVASVLCSCTRDDLSTAATSVDQSPAAGREEEQLATSVFECGATAPGSFEFTVRRDVGQLSLWLPLQFDRPYVVLTQLDSGDYRDGDVVVRLHERSADLDIGARQFRGCEENRVRSVWEDSKLNGNDFRAVGTNPAWSVEIRAGGEIVFASAADGIRVAAPAPEPETNDDFGTAVYRATTMDGETFDIAIGPGTCPAPDRPDLEGTVVAVTLGGTSFSGCGHALH